MDIKTTLYMVLKPVRLNRVTYKIGDSVALLPKQAVFLLTNGTLEAAKIKKEAKA
ncbi:MAG: hypothetical protein P1P78_11390 [Methyloprofundus sp.]|nr:hypothetical protein [Methyloprofundus sp.]